MSADFHKRLLEIHTGLEWTAEHKFHPVRRWRFDFAQIDHKIAVEIEGGVWTGGRHTSGKGYTGDMEKYNAAQLLGWKVYRFAPAQINEMLETVKSEVRKEKQ